MTENEQSKREFIKKTAYVIPSILTLKAIPSFAGTGSGEAKTAESYSDDSGTSESYFGEDKKGNNGVGDGWNSKPHGNPGKKEKENDERWGNKHRP